MDGDCEGQNNDLSGAFRPLDSSYNGNDVVSRHDESDGQRNSLSLDEDGGTHFDHSSNLETVLRNVGATRDENAKAISFNDAFGNNDILFNPAQRLNFDDDDSDDVDNTENDMGAGDENLDGMDIRNELEKEGLRFQRPDARVIDSVQQYDDDEFEDTNGGVSVMIIDEVSSGDPEDGSDYLQHRPWVNGSDVVEDSNQVPISLPQTQSQNVRIIEGHDSSLLDDGNMGGAFGFNFLHASVRSNSPAITSGGPVNETDVQQHNLYDSLETELLPSNSFRVTEEEGRETSTSEYYSLIATMSNGNASDSFLQVGDATSSQILAGQSSSNSANALNENLYAFSLPREQSPSMNAQQNCKMQDSGSVLSMEPKVNLGLTNSNDGLNVELSEEGLAQNTHMLYDQPISSTGTMEVTAVEGSASLLARQNTLEGRIQMAADSQSMKLNASQSLPNSSIVIKSHLIQSKIENENFEEDQMHSKRASSQTEAMNAINMNLDQRQAGAGSSGYMDENLQAQSQPSFKGGKPKAKKSQARRPAVQGSASAGDHKRPLSVGNTMTSVTSSTTTSVNHAMTVGGKSSSTRIHTQGSVSSSQLSKSKQIAATSSQHTAYKQNPNSNGGVGSLNSGVNSPLPSRTNSHTSLVSAVSSHSRVGGVGKESHVRVSQPASQSGPLLGTAQHFPHSNDMPGHQKVDSLLFGKAMAPDSATHATHMTPHQHQHPHSQSQSHRIFHNQQSQQQQQHQQQTLPLQQQQNTFHMQELYAGDAHQNQAHGVPPSNLPPGQSVAHHPQQQQHIAKTRPTNAASVGTASGTLSSIQIGNQGHVIPMPFANQMHSPAGSECSHQSFNREAVVTQMDAMKKVIIFCVSNHPISSHKTSTPIHENTKGVGDICDYYP